MAERLRHNGFTLVEALLGISLCSILVLSGLFLSGQAATKSGASAHSMRAYFSMQNFAENLLVNFGQDGSLETGDHGPVYYDRSGNRLLSDEGHAVSLTWHVTSNDPVKNVAKIEISASWFSDGIPQKASTTVYRKQPYSTTASSTVVVPVPTPVPPLPVPPDFVWRLQTAAPPVCEAGTQIQTWKCFDQNHNVFGTDSDCAMAKPADLVSTCTPVALEYDWLVGGQMPCDTNTGQRWRGVTCRSSWGRDEPDSNCASKGPKPPNVISCVGET